MRRLIIAILMIIIFLLIFSQEVTGLSSSINLYYYFIKNSRMDTGAMNSVTSIYLNYRVFDTLFETLLLLVSVIGIIYFSRHEGDY